MKPPQMALSAFICFPHRAARFLFCLFSHNAVGRPLAGGPRALVLCKGFTAICVYALACYWAPWHLPKVVYCGHPQSNRTNPRQSFISYMSWFALGSKRYLSSENITLQNNIRISFAFTLQEPLCKTTSAPLFKTFCCQYRPQEHLYQQRKNCVMTAFCQNCPRGLHCKSLCYQLNNLESEMKGASPSTESHCQLSVYTREKRKEAKEKR